MLPHPHQSHSFIVDKAIPSATQSPSFMSSTALLGKSGSYRALPMGKGVAAAASASAQKTQVFNGCNRRPKICCVEDPKICSNNFGLGFSKSFFNRVNACDWCSVVAILVGAQSRQEQKLQTSHLQEMVFGESSLVLKHVNSGIKIHFNAFDALNGWKQEALPPIEVPAAVKWKFRSKTLQKVILDYDYTFTTPYCGSETIGIDTY
ncbi:hypothetical protein F2P56_016318 [Juglans regia]|uniref:TIP41-like protein n=2 Tax=Juglans regia TaxID=51240 RepID=A0A833XH89_JUGRE|nr:uncharacterized protein LOC109001995 [Juglans regia]KAF5466392.1 hypothetical protein F2P56_016318 [Juglans regia]